MTEFSVLVEQWEKDGGKDRLAARLVRNTEHDLSDDLGCVLWTGPKNHRGYGLINFRHKGRVIQFKAHRLFLALRLKREIAPGMEAGHLCEKKACVKHVVEQTRNDNMREVNGRQKRQKDGKFAG